MRYGILYGPVFMALCGPSDRACVQPGGEAVARLEMTPSELISRLRQANGQDTLTFAVQGEGRYQLEPYISVRDAEEFTCFPFCWRRARWWSAIRGRLSFRRPPQRRSLRLRLP